MKSAMARGEEIIDRSLDLIHDLPPFKPDKDDLKTSLWSSNQNVDPFL
jgi:hypothetical protein